MQPGDIVARHDQPAEQGIVVFVIRGVILFVHWHGRPPSYEHAHDLVTKKTPAEAGASRAGNEG
jgi:hypothetical protein